MEHGKGDDSDEEFYVAPYIEEPYDPNKIPMYCKNLVYDHGVEYSLEEIRSRRYMSINYNENLKLKDINAVKLCSENSIKIAHDEMSSGARKKCLAVLDAAKDKENYPDLKKQDLKGVNRVAVLQKQDQSNVSPREIKQQALMNDGLADKENNPDFTKKTVANIENALPVLRMPKQCIVPPKDKLQHKLINEVFKKESNQMCVKTGGSEMEKVPPSLKKQNQCIAPPRDKEHHVPIADAFEDKENNPEFVKSSIAANKESHPVSSMPNYSIEDKTFTKFDGNDGDDYIFTKPGCLELDVTSYTKAFTMPAAISTPAVGTGKSRNVKGSGSESGAVRTCIAEKLDNVAGPGLSMIEETSREGVSGSTGSSSAATLHATASDSQNHNSAINGVSAVNSLSRVPSMLGGGTAEISKSQVSRIPCSLTRTKSRRTAADDTAKDTTIDSCATDQNESVDFNSKSINVKRSNKSNVSVAMNEICKQMKEINIATDPFSKSQIDYFLSNLSVPVSNRIGYYSVPQKIPIIKTNSDLHLRKEARDGGHLFRSLKIVGQGAYAKVYKAYSMKWKKMVALKVQKPAFPWEFYISHEVHSRITDHIMKNSFVNVIEGCFFNDASVLICDFLEHGTLLDVINSFKIRRIRFPESLAVYFTLEVLRIIRCLHNCKIIHGDIKPDNFLLRRLPQVNEDLSSFGQTALQLIDLGQCIDMTLYSPNTCFDSVFQKTFFQCPEMRTKRMWTYQIDMFHIASLVQVMIFGDFMDIICKDGVWTSTKKIPRFLNQDLWNWFFNLMLNIESCTKLPNLSEVIAKMEKIFLETMIQDIGAAVSDLRKFLNEDKTKAK
ncbi:uncharacterized protein [Hetaerina americana]|uniref:uncharacterized protein n=1 Tax=Hetaerina americana TaxID=62018 RepID=UPI003A7F2318